MVAKELKKLLKTIRVNEFFLCAPPPRFINDIWSIKDYYKISGIPFSKDGIEESMVDQCIDYVRLRAIEVQKKQILIKTISYTEYHEHIRLPELSWDNYYEDMLGSYRVKLYNSIYKNKHMGRKISPLEFMNEGIPIKEWPTNNPRKIIALPYSCSIWNTKRQ